MAIEIREIRPVKSELKPFVTFPIDTLYAGNPYYVPALVTDEIDTLRPSKNPAFEFCEAVYYMAFRDGKPAGRIAGIINRGSMSASVNRKHASGLSILSTTKRWWTPCSRRLSNGPRPRG